MSYRQYFYRAVRSCLYTGAKNKVSGAQVGVGVARGVVGVEVEKPIVGVAAIVAAHVEGANPGVRVDVE